MQLGGIKFKMKIPIFLEIFPTPNATDMIDLFTISKFANNASGGSMFLTIMGAIWAISFIGGIAEGRKAYRGWIFANFICTVLTIPMALLGFIASSYMYFFILMLGFGLIWAKLAESKG